MLKKIKLSIIIINYNSREFIDKCLLSLRKNLPLRFGLEILILDNASIDGSYLFLKKKYPDIYITRSEKNLGFAKANNELIKKSKGEYVLLLNPDTIVSPKALDLMVEYLDLNKTVAILSPKIVLPNGEIDDACHRGFPTPWNAFCHFTGISKKFPHSKLLNGYHMGYQNMNIAHEIDSGVGAALMFRRKVGLEVGLLDEDYFWYGEDLDFCFKVKQKGGKIVFLPNAHILHYKGVTSGIKRDSVAISTASYQTRIRATESRFDVMKIFYEKHYSKKYSLVIKKIVLWCVSAKKWWAIKSL